MVESRSNTNLKASLCCNILLLWYTIFKRAVVMRNKRGKYSENLWGSVQTLEEWETWLQHSWNEPSRYTAYRVIRDLVERVPAVTTFGEFGFGGAFDFLSCFKELHDTGQIVYTGWDLTEKFVEFAKSAYPSYAWRIGGLLDVAPNRYDVTYSRHILQHVSPNVYEDCLRAQLNATLRFSIIVWRYPPQEPEYIHMGCKNSWQTAWGFDRTHRIIEDSGFKSHIVEVEDSQENIYTMRRIAE